MRVFTRAGIILGIDPGPAECGFCVVKEGKPVDAGKISNADMRTFLRNEADTISAVAIESIQSYGMAVGKETFETCYQIGRLIEIAEIYEIPCSLYPRPEYMTAICGRKSKDDKRGADARLKASLELRFGGYKKGEPLEVLKGDSDKRSAFAVAAYHLDISAIAP